MITQRDPKSIAREFNEYINSQNLEGQGGLMSEDHVFIDREGNIQRSKKVMVQNWKKFFSMFPHYRNTFTRMESRENLVVILGHAYWSEDNPRDPAIWTAKITDGRVSEWRVYADTRENRFTFNLAGATG